MSTRRSLERAPAAVLVVLVTIGGSVAEHRPFPARYSTTQLVADFDVFEAAMRETHGGLHVFRTPAEIDTVFARARDRLADARTERELHLAIAWVIAEVRDGHTWARMSGAALEYMYRQPTFPPFRLAFVDGRAYLARDYSVDLGHLLGSEVVAIDGVPMRQVLDGLLAYVSGDGSATSGRYHRLTSVVTLGRLYQLVFGPTDVYRLELRPPGATETVRVAAPAIDHATVDERWAERYPEEFDGGPNEELSFLDDPPHTAVLRIAGFWGDRYPEFVEQAFAAIDERDVQHLIVDLRGNVGGLEIHGQQLVSHLVDAPFDFYDRVAVRQRRFRAFDHSSNTAVVYDESEATAADDGSFHLTETRRSFISEQAPRAPHYAGALYVLTDGGTFSTASDTTAALHHLTDAVLIGEETGGSYHGNTSGARLDLHLPHTKSRVRIPIERYYNAFPGDAPSDRGVLPHHPVSWSVDDLIGGGDTVLEFALERIRERAMATDGASDAEPRVP